MKNSVPDLQNINEINKEQRPERIERLKNAVQSSQPGVCPERALIWTKYYKKKENRKKRPAIQIAEVMREYLMNKKITIYPDELITGNYSSKRVGGSIYPELHGVIVLFDLFKFSRRKTAPLRISMKDKFRLLGIMPFWLMRFLGWRAYPDFLKKIDFVINQLQAHYYFINETGGIAHFAPDYDLLLKTGTSGIIKMTEQYENSRPLSENEHDFYTAVKIAARALADFGKRYAGKALEMADKFPEGDMRKRELEKIAEVCTNVPEKGAETFQEALQSLFFAQIAVNLESLDQGICPARIDQYLFPYYEHDIKKGIITKEQAKELLAAFCIKFSELVPVFSEQIQRIHGGMFNGQVVIVGGVDENGKDASNDLTYMLLKIMDELRMRQPNFHARVHSKAPEKYMEAIIENLAAGSSSPALYNDDVIIETLMKRGYSMKDARNYTSIGCVELGTPGRSFSSTDAALINLPLILELALNQGKRFGHGKRFGAKTPPISEMKTMQDVADAFSVQMKQMIARLSAHLTPVEIANRELHPTPLSSMLLSGCIEKGRCSSAGGADYNFSGIQGVGPADTGDSLYAIEKAVFIDRQISLQALVENLRNNHRSKNLRNYLKGLPKFGNDNPDADKWTVFVIDEYEKALSEYTNSRGGQYVPGLYSVTAHDFFGKIAGASANGRKKGEAFASGISPVNGADKSGPTAMINSVNRIDFSKIANGINLNMKFDSTLLESPTGKTALKNLIRTNFKTGGMQVQINSISPEMLKAARDNPGLYPNLLVRVSGYSAYFNDLTPKIKDEVIARSSLSV